MKLDKKKVIDVLLATTTKQLPKMYQALLK